MSHRHWDPDVKLPPRSATPPPNREVSLEAEAPEKDAFELIIERITEDAFKAVTPEEMAKVLTGQGALTIQTDGVGVVMRYVEPWERGDDAASPAERQGTGPGKPNPDDPEDGKVRFQ